MSGEPWPKAKGNNGHRVWRTPWGDAYGFDCPPAHDPLTADEVYALPDDTEITILWGGGNGPHQYLWRAGLVWMLDDPQGERWPGKRLGGLIGSRHLVGNEQYQDKVWIQQDPT